MAAAALMPVITAGDEPAVVTAWFVDEGEHCNEGQLIAEVQAEKVSIEIHAPQAGYVVNRVALGEPVPQGQPICQIVETIEKAEAPRVGSTTVGTPQVIASPAARRIAGELGVDLTSVSGTGPGGRITEADVRGATVRPPESGLRGVIARNMRRSHAETAPVTLHSTVQFRAGVPSLLTATVVRTAAIVLVDHPDLNGRREGDEFKPSGTAQIAIAIQTDAGLVTPVIREPAHRSVEELADTIEVLAERARNKSLTAVDFDGGTFTVSNLGALGIDGFTPMINLPQVAILGVGAVRRVPIIDEEGNVTPGHHMVLSLTFDHAFVDGAPAAAFLQQLGRALAG